MLVQLTWCFDELAAVLSDDETDALNDDFVRVWRALGISSSTATRNVTKVTMKFCPLLLVPRGQLLATCLLHCLYACLGILVVDRLVDKLEVTVVLLDPGRAWRICAGIRVGCWILLICAVEHEGLVTVYRCTGASVSGRVRCWTMEPGVISPSYVAETINRCFIC